MFLSKLNNVTKKYAQNIQYRGMSKCRICGCFNGSIEHILTNGSSIEFKYPEGLSHYYSTHNVQPSKEFYNYIMNFIP